MYKLVSNLIYKSYNKVGYTDKAAIACVDNLKSKNVYLDVFSEYGFVFVAIKNQKKAKYESGIL